MVIILLQKQLGKTIFTNTNDGQEEIHTNSGCIETFLLTNTWPTIIFLNSNFAIFSPLTVKLTIDRYEILITCYQILLLVIFD